MKIQAGQIAPDFIASDVNGKQVRLSDYRGKKIILSFYRNVFCPFCNRRVHQLMLNSLSFKNRDVQLLFLFESANETLKKSAFHKGIVPWPLIGDPQRKIYEQYGVERSIKGVIKTAFAANLAQAKKEVKPLNLPKTDKDAHRSQMPADFFIDEKFRIATAHVGTHMDDHIAYEKIHEFAGIENPFKNISRTNLAV